MPVRMGRGWSSVQTRLTGVMVVVAIFAALLLVAFRTNETRRMDAYMAADAKDDGELLDRALDLEGSSLAMFAKDYTVWGEMVQFVRTGDRTWAKVNLDDGIGTYRANAAWVFDPAGAPVYAVRDSTLEAPLEPLPPGLSVKDVLGDSHFCHFFIAGPDGPVEIRGATIHPSDDDDRLTPVRGYFLAARAWNGQYLAELSRLTGKTVRIEPALDRTKPSTEIARQSGEITFTRPLPGPQGKPELMLIASFRPEWIAAARRSSSSLSIRVAALALLAVLGLTLVLWLWVTRPLGRIARSLESGTTEALKPLERSRTEFGRLAQLIGQFFGQNATLAKEVTERKQAEEVARQAAQNWQATFDGINDAVCILSPEGIIRQCNAAMARLVRSAPEALVGRPCHEVVHGTFEPPTNCPLVRARASRGRERFDAVVGDRFVEVTLDPLLDETGRMTGAVHVIVDVTERKRSEQTMRESEERFRELFENMSSGVAVYETRDQGASFIFKNLNRGGERIDALRREEVVGRNVQQVFPGIEEFGLLALIRRVWQTGKPEQHPVGQYKDDRISGWRENYVYKLPSGEVVAVYDDVTARVQAEAALHESEQRFRDVALCSVDWLWEIDAQGRYTFCSEHVKRVLGYEPGELLGRTPFDLMSEAERTRVAPVFAALVTERWPLVDLENRNLTKDGREMVLLTNGVPMLDSDGNLLGYRGVDKDITERKLAEAQIEQLSRFPEENPNPVLRILLDGTLAYANPSSKLLLDVLERAPGMRMPEAWKARVREAQSSGRQCRFEAVCGNTIYSMLLSPVAGQSYVNVYGRDITERKRAETELKESELKFRAIFDGASDGMFVVDQESRRFVLANDSCLRMLGYSAEEFANLQITDLHSEEDLAFMFAQIGGLVKGPGRRGDTWFRRKDGSWLPADANPTGMTLDGKACILVVFSDITERRQAEETLRTSKAQLSNAMEIAKLGHWEYDVVEDLFTFNDNFYAIYHTMADKVGGYRMSSAEYARRFVHPDDAAMVGAEVGEAIKTTDPRFSRQLEHRIIYADGSVGHISVRFFVIKDAQGRTVKTFGANQDITERKLAEAEKAQKNAELVELNNVKNQFLGMAAHDLRNPLSIVTTASGFLLDDASRLMSEAKRTEFIRRINSSSKFMLKLIDDLLDVAKIEAGRLDLELKEEDLCGLIEHTLALNRMLADKKHIRLDSTPDCGLPLLRFDRDKVEQVLNNLISNALKFSAPGTAVTVQASRVQGSVVVSVRDQGQGIPAEELDKLFKPFGRTSARVTDGEKSTGLGLAICRRIVEGHHGRIWAESEVGKGSIFSFSLPVAGQA